MRLRGVFVEKGASASFTRSPSARQNGSQHTLYFIHFGVLYVRVHVEESCQSMHVECFHDHIERYRGILATSLGRYFEPFLFLLTTLLFFAILMLVCN